MADDRWLETRCVALEAATLVVVARVALIVASVATVRRWIVFTVPPDRATDAPAAAMIATRIGVIVGAVARRLPHTTCLVQAIVAESMLRRRGIQTSLMVGVRDPNASAALDAHAWLECAGAIVVGDAVNLREYTAFPRPM